MEKLKEPSEEAFGTFSTHGNQLATLCPNAKGYTYKELNYLTGSQKNVRGEIERRIHEHLTSTPVTPTEKALQDILSVIEDARGEFPDIVTYDKPHAEGVFMFANHCLAWAMKWLGLSTDSNRKIPILDSIRVEKTNRGERYIWTYHFVERNASPDD